MIAAVGVVLVAVHVLLPASTRWDLAFDHGAFDPVSVYTSALVHTNDRHLVGNLSGYLATTTATYGLCVRAGARRWFRVTFVAFLAALPLLVTLTSDAVLARVYPNVDPVTQGFSGVGAGFVGFLFVALLVAVRTEHGSRIAQYVGVSVWLWLLLELSLIYSPQSVFPAGTLAVVGWLFCGWGITDASDTGGREWGVRAAVRGATPVVVGTVLLTLFVYVLLPADLVNNGAVTNVFAHAAGFGYGVLGSVLTYAGLHWQSR